MKRITSGEIAVKTSIRIMENQLVTEVVPLFEQSNLDALPVYNIQDQIIGILEWHTGRSAIQTGESEISKLLLNQDYLLVSETEDIEALVHKKRAYYLVQNKNKSVVGIISQRQLNEVYIEMIRTRLSMLEAVFEHAPVGIVSIDKNGIFTSLNHAAEKIAGLNKETAIGEFITDVVPHNKVMEVLRTGIPHIDMKYRVGNRKSMATRTPIMNGSEVSGVVSILQDISELENKSEELDSVRKLNKQLEAIINASYDGIIITDCNGEYLRCNQAVENLFEWVFSKRYERNIFKNNPSDKSEIIKTVLKEKKSLTISKVLEETGVNLILTLSPVIIEDTVEYMVVNVRNITDLIQLKKEVEENKLLTERYKEELTQYRLELKSRIDFIAESPKMKYLLQLVNRLSSFDSTTLLLGESGTGKEEIARIIHLNSLRSHGPFITINCGAIPENLLESELFGYEKGAFTGAGQKGKPGMFELADKGTLFLDEVGDLPLPLQVKLLRVVQEREVTRIGGTEPTKVDVRILAATNINLEEKIKNGQFREDLYFRLNVIPVIIPPLRERMEDLIPLTRMFLDELNQFYRLSKKFTPNSYEMLLKYNWPGNVRELKNVIERCYVLSEGDAINLKEIHVPLFLSQTVAKEENMMDVEEIPSLKEAVMQYEINLIKRAIEKYGNTYKAAEVLQVNQSTVVRKLQKQEA
ncbi:sigma 54-interacting transcriptional regulator [Bacillus sp. OK048]|uniref:sigma 54-interacting transcriptional regulator n=1 Tax=Bacillus sp. OK048 TaxID=1882761 RepID=UPI0008811F8D|nr:sigma 54-interacting transcriptional regulator [Bacillus sp. OK048]SDL95772.1 PAS domain S-box-containing protein [Bacillus sp. OK048]